MNTPRVHRSLAGAVVVYECDADIAANMATYADDLDMLFVIDNSTTRNPAIEAAVAHFRHADYIFNGANLGIAAALNLAAERAKAGGAEFLLTMDQDSGFHEVAFHVFRDRVLTLPFLSDLAVAAPNFLEHESPPGTLVNSRTVITSGSIISLANHARIGPFDERLFIDDVDHDYCLRAHDLGLCVVTFADVRLRHRLGHARTISVLGRNICWNVHGPSRHYYMVRNALYMMTKHYRRHLVYSIGRLARIARTITVALLFAPQRRERLTMVIRGVRDYHAKRMGERADARGTS